MRRKWSKQSKHGNKGATEKEHLLKEKDNGTSDDKESLKLPSDKRERRKSVWAPAATATNFEDVPVLTICPYCSQKVVTKTHFKRGRKNWLDLILHFPSFLELASSI